jgi:hypothetical protein
MSKFIEIAKELGWEQIEKGILVFKSTETDRNGYYSINFVAGDSYDNFDLDDDRITEEFVNNYIKKIACCNKCTINRLNEVKPMIISDYFAHRMDRENELKWAKRTIVENPEINKNVFPESIRDLL